MPTLIKSIFFPFVLLLLKIGVAHPVENPQPLTNPDAPAIENTFSIFAYGDNISGLPVFYADENAAIGDSTLSKATVAQPVYFTATGQSSGVWVAHPNRTTISEAQFSSMVLYLDDTTGAVAFISPEDTTGKDTASFSVYGSYVLIGATGANFYAELTDVAGVYSLLWSSGDETGTDKIPLTLRTTAPAS